MTEEKRNRIVAASIVTVVLLIAILASIVVYQLVIVVSIRKQKKHIESEITRLEQATESAQDYLDYLEDKDRLRDELIANGYHKK